MPPQRAWFLNCFDLQTGLDFDHFGLKSGMAFKGTMRAYKRSCHFKSRSENWGARSENGCGKWHILVWNRVRIWKTGPLTNTKNSEEVLSPPTPLNYQEKEVLSPPPPSIIRRRRSFPPPFNCYQETSHEFANELSIDEWKFNLSSV